MSGLKPITVNTAPEADPHIYAEDDAAIYQSIFGSDGVMTIGQQCESQVISNNKVRVKDGVIVVGGHVARIPYGEYIDCEIANGQSGVNRNDIIMAKFVTTGSGGIDTYTCEVKQGVAGSSASDPALTQNDIYAGGKIREMPLYRVKIEGLSIVAVEQLFKLVPTIPELEEQLADLNSKIDVAVTRSAQNTNSNATYQCTYYPALGLVFFRAYVPSRPISLAKGVESVLFTLADGPWVPETYYALYVHGGVNNALNARTNGRNITLTPRLQDISADNIVSIGGFWFVG